MSSYLRVTNTSDSTARTVAGISIAAETTAVFTNPKSVTYDIGGAIVGMSASDGTATASLHADLVSTLVIDGKDYTP